MPATKAPPTWEEQLHRHVDVVLQIIETYGGERRPSIASAEARVAAIETASSDLRAIGRGRGVR